MYSILFLFGVAFVACLALTPLVRAGSTRLGLMDHPTVRRKVHTVAVPRTGGVAIVGAYLLALGLLLVSPLRGANAVDLPLALSLLPAACIVFATGLVDDLVSLKPGERLLIQVLAAVMAYSSGIHVAGAAGFVADGWWSLPITVLWLVGCANAVNLIDGMDGLASGVGLFAAFTCLAAALLQHNAPLALATAPLVGALLAFLRYNFNPASIFLGDCGSLTIGFLLGCFGAVWSQKSATLLGMTAPLMALSIPLIDTTVAVIRRFLRHQPIFLGDRRHIHHRLLDRGFSPRAAVLLLYAVCTLGAAFSLLQTATQSRYNGLLLVAFCGVVWVGLQFLDYGEFSVAQQLVAAGTFRRLLHARVSVADVERRVAQAVTETDYWDVVRQFSRDCGCTQVRMRLSDAVFEDSLPEHDPMRSCTIRIPLERGGYLNFRYTPDGAAHHAMAVSVLGNLLQRALAAQRPPAHAPLSPHSVGMPAHTTHPVGIPAHAAKAAFN
jgi:UDP-GlcNAc:undecaprenyl-phosphate/decaprenyl-phosphate GlcNAc-1-phosphate transferase